MAMTEKELQEFWKWCGWWLGDEIEGKAWHHSDFKDTRPKAPGYAFQVEHNYTYFMPSLDLNNLFKYAVPKLIELGFDVDLFTDDGYYFGRIRKTFAFKWHISTIGYLDPTEALYQAIQEARKK